MPKHNGLSTELEHLRTKANIRTPDVARILGTASRTVARWNSGGSYPHPRNERLVLDLVYIVKQLSEFYSDPHTTRAWLYSRHKYFDGATPVDLIKAGRIQEVLDALEDMNNPTST